MGICHICWSFRDALPVPHAAPPPTASRLISRTVGIVLLALTFLGGILLLPATAGTTMLVGSCSGVVDDVPACVSSLRAGLGFALPWLGWLIGSFGALGLFIPSWPRGRHGWPWPLVGAVCYAFGFLLALFGFEGLLGWSLPAVPGAADAHPPRQSRGPAAVSWTATGPLWVAPGLVGPRGVRGTTTC